MEVGKQGMNIEYSSNLSSVDWERVAELFAIIGWGHRKPEEIHSAFKTSSCVRFAYSNGVIVGFGRTVDDGKYYALIVDLVVRPEFQGNGIGKTILGYLTKALEGYVFTTLTSAVGKGDFYLGQGWFKQKTSFIWPRSARQKLDHT